MALMVKGQLYSGVLPPLGATKAYIVVLKKYLSEPYELRDRTVLIGELVDVERLTGFGPTKDPNLPLSELKGKSLKFILRLGLLGEYDELYISKDSWPLLRDYGILPGEYLLTVKITKAIVDNKEIEIYPKRDITHP